MGALCSCFRVPEVEDTVEPQSSNHGNCRCPSCFIHNLKNKGASSSSSIVAPNDARIETGTRLPNNVNPPNPQSQNASVNMRCEKDTSHCHPEPELLSRNNAKICMTTNDGVNIQNRAESKERHSESSRTISSEKVDGGVAHVNASEDEDVCPTCFEEYTQENPKIVTQCHHSYHLSCIYNWMERSEKCPFCAKLMVFSETT
ncbi:E3 ubiquitin-protein ligase At3g02290-like isoform X2 [Actinidia eriantha]|uniref:E3 ubiquitin-protein ligase At3g02290-like isoform X2 n=1 Tax=Actinidia eriantha TaxID=165200 RepID=UPI00258D4547|nr:E3 ubiquitin-protein ligase At3g02290-like isoform X2 [Actinidia eriantha]